MLKNIRRTHFPKVSIIVVTFNALDFIKQCFASIKKYTDDYELIVVDNGSQANTVKWLKKQTGLITIFNSENRGFAAGNNQGIKIAKGKYVLLLNSDTVVTKGWLPRLIRSIEENDKIGIVGPYSNYAVGDQNNPVFYSSLEEIHAFAEGFNRKEKETYHISGFCMLLKRKTLNKVGLFDENFKIANFEDVDYCIRVVRAGFKLKVANCFIHHFGSRSFIANSDRIDLRQVYYKNFKLLTKKWSEQEIKKAYSNYLF